MIQFPSFSNRRRWMYIVNGMIILLFIPLWVLFVAPRFTRLPDNFSYYAKLLSIDNFYDEATKQFQGENISKTSFSYRVIATNQNYDTVENIFSVSTLNDKPIISIARLYFIDPYTWQHVNVPGKQARQGYLFGPHWAGKDEFHYWHINYNTQATMRYVDSEMLDGLSVNHYQAEYVADQTANLTNLPGVPDKRGIRANIKLQLWIEPVSGWLVKYQDNTLAEYFDIKTGQTIAPWNQFSNRYTEASVREQVSIASFLKWKILLTYVGVPIFLLLVSIIFFLMDKVIKQLLRVPITVFNTLLNMSMLLVLGILFIVTINHFFFNKKSVSIYTIGISKWNDSLDHEEAILGFKEGLAESGFIEGENINFLIKNPDSNIEKQVDVIQSFQKNKVNLIYTLSTPGTLVAKGMTRKKTPIIFSDVMYPEEANVITTMQSSKSNIVGIRNYIPPAIQFNLFEKIYPNIKAIGFVHRKGDPESEIEYQEFKGLLAHRNIDVLDIPAIDLEDLNIQIQSQNPKYAALFLACDALMQQGGGAFIAEYGRQHKVPTFGCDRQSIHNGVLIGITIDPYVGGVLAGKQAALILKGAEPSWIHTEQPMRVYYMINLSTAKILGVTISEDILKNADYIVREKP